MPACQRELNKYLLNKLIFVLQVMAINSERESYLTKITQLVKDLNLSVWLQR